MNDPNTMTMLYKVADGSVKDQYYGESQDQHPEKYDIFLVGPYL
jgi:hypothetical protein